jgi:hypothetical protein
MLAAHGPEHGHHAVVAAPEAMATASAMGGHDIGGMMSGGMAAAHLLAALLCGLWLSYGERAAFRLLRAVAGWFVAPLRLALLLPTPSHRPRVRPRRIHRARPLPRFLLVHALTSRGPPSGCAVL